MRRRNGHIHVFEKNGQNASALRAEFKLEFFDFQIFFFKGRFFVKDTDIVKTAIILL